MNEDLLAKVEREVFGRDGVFRERDKNTVSGIDITGCGFRQWASDHAANLR